MVLLTVPGQRWEIEFLGNGSVEVERFISNGEICGEEALAERRGLRRALSVGSQMAGWRYSMVSRPLLF